MKKNLKTKSEKITVEEIKPIQERANMALAEIKDILKKYSVDMIAILNYTKTGIIPSITMVDPAELNKNNAKENK